MCVQIAQSWSEALRRTLRRVYDPTTRTPVPWLLSGDAALALQGVHTDPEVIEFRAMSQYATAYFAQFMKPYQAPANRATIVYRRGSNVPPSDKWRSNVHQGIVAWSNGGRAQWLGRWQVDSACVQICYAQTAQADPIGVARKAAVKRVSFEGMSVAVVPLECLLADSALRNDAQLTHRILHTMRACGYDADLLRLALDELPAGRATRILRLLDLSLIAG